MKKTLILALVLLIILMPAYAIETIISHEEIRFDLIRTDPSPLEPGETFDIWFDITNIQPYIIRDLKISVVASFPFTLLDSNQSSILINELKPNEKRSIKYNVKINKNINEGLYQLALQYYSNRIGAMVSKTFNLNVKTTNVIVSTTEINLEPERIHPGSTFKLIVGITNTVNSAITDITADLSLDGTPFATLGSSSEKKIRQLAANANANLEYDMIANPDSSLKVYKVPLILTYYDQLGAKYATNSTIGITVYSKPEYNIDLENSEVFIKGQTGEITISIANKGNSELKFLNVELLKNNSYDIISNPRIYVGNLDSDDFETATYKIHTKSSKPTQLKLKIDYKDTYNNGFSDSTQVTLPLYSRYEAQKLGLIKKSYLWMQVLIFIMAAIFLYKFYKVWKFERDIERSLAVIYRNTIKWFRNRLRR